MKILFVCLGNICRSPSAESIFKKLCLEQGLPYQCDSAGTSGNHVGESSDPRSIRHAQARGYEMTHLARKLVPEDFSRFDLIIGMDEANVLHIKSLDPQGQHQHRVHLMTDFIDGKAPRGIPDPYYGEAAGFEQVLDLLEKACAGLLRTLKENLILRRSK